MKGTEKIYRNNILKNIDLKCMTFVRETNNLFFSSISQIPADKLLEK